MSSTSKNPLDFSYHFPINTVSFGQVSTGILRDIKSRVSDSYINLFTIGSPDLSSSTDDEEFKSWISKSIDKAPACHSRKDHLLKLWHLYDHNYTLSSYSDEQSVITFHELDSLTKREINISKSIKNIYLTSQYSIDVFANHGIKAKFLPLYFDHYHFHKTNKKYFDDDRITFNLVGKFEKRKNHKQIIQAWLKRFGNDNRYFLQCAVHNTFLKHEENNQIFASLLDGVRYSNINFLTFMAKNSQYNDFLNSGDVVIGGSGGEGWGLPEFHSVGLGKYGVIMNSTGYKSWANDSNSILFEEGPKEEIYDDMFFKKGMPYNQGNYFSLNSDAFIDACEKAIEQCRIDRTNHNGVDLTKEFTAAKTVDTLLSNG